jgi:hypothetical protein
MYPHATNAFCCHACISATYGKRVGGKLFIPYKFFFRKINFDNGTTASCARSQTELLGSRNVHPVAPQTSTRRFDILRSVATPEYFSCFFAVPLGELEDRHKKIKLLGQRLIDMI